MIFVKSDFTETRQILGRLPVLNFTQFPNCDMLTDIATLISVLLQLFFANASVQEHPFILCGSRGLNR